MLIKAKMEPVAIGRLERFVGDNASRSERKRERVVAPRFEQSLGQVAIVGSGPGGLAAAADLVKFGAEVTVYEALHVVGGVLRYGIPSFRLPRDIIDREVKQPARLRRAASRPTRSSARPSRVAQLTDEMGFDAVFVAAGAGAPAFLGIPGEFGGPGLFGQRVPDAREPDGRRPASRTATRRSRSATASS